MFELYINKKYLLIPIEENAPEQRFYITTNKKSDNIIYSVRLAKNNIDYYVPFEVSDYLEQTIQINFLSSEFTIDSFKEIIQSDTFEKKYTEKYRPLFHYSPPYGWMNDPNGMVFKDGIYHLFYQFNPFGNTWGNMSWGHAVSKDLMKWETKPTALLPDSLGAIYSGGATVDKNNDAGFGKDALVFFYTSASEQKQSQSLAYSLDNGATMHKYKNNPVLKDDFYKDFRDPKVFWHQETEQWIMSLATSQLITFYSSKDLKSWIKLSDFGNEIGAHGGVWECPDLFPLVCRGITKWILLVSINPGGPNGGNATQYFIGCFDGKSFVADDLDYPLWIDYGRDNYAGVTWENHPHDKRFFIGWMSNWDYSNNVPTEFFRNAMTVPRELSLECNNNQKYYLKNYPIEEIEKLRSNKKEFQSILKEKYIKINEIVLEGTKAFEINFELVADNNNQNINFSLKNDLDEAFNFSFNIKEELFIVNRDHSGNVNFSDKFSNGNIVSPLIISDKYSVRMLMDVASVEIFINQGDTVQSNTVFPTKPYSRIEIDSNDLICINNFITYEMKQTNEIINQ